MVRKPHLATTTEEPNYDPFTTQYLHPIYGFFFPLDPNARAALSNKWVTITRDGFRGSSPSFTKPLAFLLGGSAAFGDGVSSDETTITGYLNRLHDGLQFINAGVPSWNSTQELERLADQIIHLKPSLVVSFSLYNDVGIAADFVTRAPRLPPGSPEHFAELQAIVERDGKVRFVLQRKVRLLLERLFPHIAELLDRGDSEPRAASKEELMSALNAASKKFVENQQAMQALSEGLQFRFVTVIQPMKYASAKISPLGDEAEKQWELKCD